MLTEQEIEKIRQFNRQYTKRLGILKKQAFDTDMTWSEGRILMEVGINHLTTPAILAKWLDLDKSYASRIINRLVAGRF